VIYLVAGARPNFMKVAAVAKDLDKSGMPYKIVHTGQHYDTEMSGSFFQDLDLPVPHIHLGVGSGTHAEQTGKVMMAFEKVCLDERPRLVIVVGDVNSTVACALVSAKMQIPVAHVEAGLRSFDRSMPEEINRLLTDQISDLLFTTCADADENLKREGIPDDRIFFVGNVMIDTLYRYLELAGESDALQRLGLLQGGRVRPYALLTLHRPSNVDERTQLERLLEVLNRIHRKIPLVFPAHPRTVKQMKEFDLISYVTYAEDVSIPDAWDSLRHLLMIPPMGYIDFLSLMAKAKLVLTDSGGIQEETTILGVPCLTLRENTERPITLKQGTNRLVGRDPEVIFHEASKVLEEKRGKTGMPKFWDGRAAERIVKILAARFKTEIA